MRVRQPPIQQVYCTCSKKVPRFQSLLVWANTPLCSDNQAHSAPVLGHAQGWDPRGSQEDCPLLSRNGLFPDLTSCCLKLYPQKGFPLGQEIYSPSFKSSFSRRNHLTFSPSCESYQLKSYRRLDWKKKQRLPWARGCFPGRGPGGGSAEVAHIGIFRKKGIKERESTRRNILWTKEGDATEGDRLAHFCLLLPYRGPAVGEQEPLYQRFHPLLSPTPATWGAYPSSCYKGSILTNIIKNQGEAQGEPGVEETSKIWRPLVPQMGRRWVAWRRSAPPVFPAPTHHCFAGGAGPLPPYVFSFLCSIEVPSWGNGNCAVPCPGPPPPPQPRATCESHHSLHGHSFLGPQPLLWRTSSSTSCPLTFGPG